MRYIVKSHRLVEKSSHMAVLSDLEPCSKYEITIQKYLGLRNTKENNKEPLFTGETGTSISVYTAIDSSLPFNLQNVRVQEELSSVRVSLTHDEWPCIDMISMSRFQICSDQDESSCFQDGIIRRRDQGMGSSITTGFENLSSCTSYLVSIL